MMYKWHSIKFYSDEEVIEWLNNWQSHVDSIYITGIDSAFCVFYKYKCQIGRNEVYVSDTPSIP